jgi:hypothetical protein
VFLDKRDEEHPFVWPEYEAKDASGAMDGAPVSAFAEELRTKVSTAISRGCLCVFSFVYAVCSNDRSQVKQHFETEAKRRGVSLLTATKARISFVCSIRSVSHSLVSFGRFVVIVCSRCFQMFTSLQATSRRAIELAVLFCIFAATLPSFFAGAVRLPCVYCMICLFC